MASKQEIKTILTAEDKASKIVNNYSKTLDTMNDQMAKNQAVSNRSNYALTNFSRIIQDAPYGMMAVSNNLEGMALSFIQLKKETGSTGGALKALFKSMAGPGGLIFGVGLLSAAFSILPMIFRSAKKSAMDLAKGFDEVTKISDNLTKSQYKLKPALFANRIEMDKYKNSVKFLKEEMQEVEKLMAFRFLGEVEKSGFKSLQLSPNLAKDLTKINDIYSTSVMKMADNIKKLPGLMQNYIISGQSAAVMQTNGFKRIIRAYKATGQKLDELKVAAILFGKAGADAYGEISKEAQNKFFKTIKEVTNMTLKNIENKNKKTTGGIKESWEDVYSYLNKRWLSNAHPIVKSQENLYIKIEAMAKKHNAKIAMIDNKIVLQTRKKNNLLQEMVAQANIQRAKIASDYADKQINQQVGKLEKALNEMEKKVEKFNSIKAKKLQDTTSFEKQIEQKALDMRTFATQQSIQMIGQLGKAYSDFFISVGSGSKFAAEEFLANMIKGMSQQAGMMAAYHTAAGIAASAGGFSSKVMHGSPASHFKAAAAFAAISAVSGLAGGALGGKQGGAGSSDVSKTNTLPDNTGGPAGNEVNQTFIIHGDYDMSAVKAQKKMVEMTAQSIRSRAIS